MEKEEWRDLGFKIGDIWLSTKQYSCPVCGLKGNTWTLDYYRMGCMPRLCCEKGHKPYNFDVSDSFETEEMDIDEGSSVEKRIEKSNILIVIENEKERLVFSRMIKS